MYIREKYLERLKSMKDLNIIKVITGIRRCGKSTLLLQFKNYLHSSGISNENILYMNFESSEWFSITNYKELVEYVHSKKRDKKMYILLDEVQVIDKWEKAVNSFLVDLDCDIYITGSNAFLLSSELTTLLAGRVFTLKLYPFSFKEYNDFKSDSLVTDNFKMYLKYGGMPMTLFLEDEANLKNYLSDIKDVVLKNDVIARNKIKDVALLDNLLRYLASTCGCLTNASKISQYLNKYNSKIHNETIDNYLAQLINAYIVYRVPRFKLDGKELLRTQGKYYFTCNGIRNIINGVDKYNSGSSLENIVYMELLRRGYEVFVGKYKDLEIDFVVVNGEDIVYYQVCRSIINDDVLLREMVPLLATNDNYPKYIITADNLPEYNKDGIKIINIIDFLLN